MRRLVLFLASVSISTAAAAQPAAPNPNADSQAAVWVLNAFARCIADTQPGLAERILATPFLSDEQSVLMNKEFSGLYECEPLANALDERPEAGIIGGMAEEFYVSRHAGTRVEAVIARGFTVKAKSPAEDIALCLVRSNPKGAQAVVDSKPTSAVESKAIDKLVPNIGPCTPKGETMELNRSTVRTLVAVGLYLLAERPAPPAWRCKGCGGFGD
jgi:hypothetical protein